MLTPLRLFCLPFQDLLSSESRKSKQKGVIARATVLPLWRWLSETLLPDETLRYGDQTKALIVAKRNEEAMARTGEYWTLASATLTSPPWRRRKQARA